VADSISVFSKDRNFSPSPDLSLSHQTFFALSAKGVNSGSEKLIMPYLLVILKVTGTICLFPHTF